MPGRGGAGATSRGRGDERARIEFHFGTMYGKGAQVATLEADPGRRLARIDVDAVGARLKRDAQADFPLFGGNVAFSAGPLVDANDEVPVADTADREFDHRGDGAGFRVVIRKGRGAVGPARFAGDR